MASLPTLTPGQMDVFDCIAEVASYVEPCPECACGKHGNCDGRALDHARDEIVPCPCRAAGHPKELP